MPFYPDQLCDQPDHRSQPRCQYQPEQASTPSKITAAKMTAAHMSAT